MGAKFVSLRFAIWTASLACSCGAADCDWVVSKSFAADLPAMKAPQPFDYDWTGFYVGGHVGLAAGRERSTTVAGGAPIGGAFGLYRSPNAFTEGDSSFDGVQFGYNYMTPSRVVLGIEADGSFPGFPDPTGLTIGGSSNFSSAVVGNAAVSETVLASGTLRGRIGYAPGHWLFYATGGLGWTYNRQTLTQIDGGNSEDRFLYRFGRVAGAGIEVPIAPSWTVRSEYLWTGFSSASLVFAATGARTDSDFSVHQLRLGLNYRFDDPSRPAAFAPSRFVSAADIFAVHGQATFVEQAYPAFRSPYEGPNSLGGGGQARETFDLTLSIGVKLWQGTEFWANPEIDQGFGFNDTHGAAGFPSAESYKLGSATPYARLQRAFLRQTINLGGDTEEFADDFYQFKGTRSTDRLVLTVGRFGIVDIFDTNRCANNPKADFLNWSLINAGTFDYAGDGWGYTYGAAAEWYTGRWTLRLACSTSRQRPRAAPAPSATRSIQPCSNSR